jgi:LPXTG-motif cell wall-anchored protein
MKLRGFTRLAAATAASVLLVGMFAAPARAEGDDEIPPVDLDGAVLILDEPIQAASAPTKGCAGIDTGTAVKGTDGWLFSKPRGGEYTDLQYLFLYAKVDDPKTIDDLAFLLLNDDGVFLVDDSDAPTAQDLVKSLKADVTQALTAKLIADDYGIPTLPAPNGVTGKITETGAWIKTPAGWWLGAGVGLTNPMLEDATFELVRACVAAVDTSPSPSLSPSGGPSLPVTGSNIWLLTGGGAALVAVGAVLFMAYRRRQSVKFVA